MYTISHPRLSKKRQLKEKEHIHFAYQKPPTTPSLGTRKERSFDNDRYSTACIPNREGQSPKRLLTNRGPNYLLKWLGLQEYNFLQLKSKSQYDLFFSKKPDLLPIDCDRLQKQKIKTPWTAHKLSIPKKQQLY